MALTLTEIADELRLHLAPYEVALVRDRVVADFMQIDEAIEIPIVAGALNGIVWLSDVTPPLNAGIECIVPGGMFAGANLDDLRSDNVGAQVAQALDEVLRDLAETAADIGADGAALEIISRSVPQYEARQFGSA